MADPILVVMAAGLGSRFGGLKQLAEVGPAGEHIIDYTLHDAAAAGFGRVVFVIRGEHQDLFREVVGSRAPAGLELRYAHQDLADLPGGRSVPEGRTKPWGTAHAVLAARDHLDAPFAVVNADDFYGRAAFDRLAGFLRTAGDRDAAMVGFRLGNTVSPNGTVSRGVCAVGDDGRLQGVVEHTAISADGSATDPATGQNVTLAPETIVSMNAWGLPPAVLPLTEELFARFLDIEVPQSPAKAEIFLPDVVRVALERGDLSVTVLPSEDQWHGITYPEDAQDVKAALAALVAGRAYPSPLAGSAA